MNASHPTVLPESCAPLAQARRRAPRLMSLFAALLVAWAAAPLAAQGANPDEPRAQPEQSTIDLNIINIGPNVAAIGGGLDGNVMVVQGGGAALVVDGQGPVNFSAVVASVGMASSNPVRWLVNTHYHADHVGANPHYGDKRVTIVAHRATAGYLRRAGGVPELDWQYEALPPEGWPSMELDSSATIKLGTVEVRLLHLPAAHTDGDLAVYVPSDDVLHTGDVFDHGSYPFVDLWHGGSTDGMIAALDTLLALCTETTTVIPGHGTPCTRVEMAAFRDMLSNVRFKVNAALDKDQSLEELVSMGPTADFDGTFGTPGSGRRLVALFYKDLSERRMMEAPR